MAGDEVVMMVPMDVDEDGRLDILAQKCPLGSTDASRCEVGLLYNNVIFDSFFVKAMMLA
jgi:hypothetical protein